jgi:hypothetical protein
MKVTITVQILCLKKEDIHTEFWQENVLKSDQMEAQKRATMLEKY